MRRVRQHGLRPWQRELLELARRVQVRAWPLERALVRPQAWGRGCSACRTLRVRVDQTTHVSDRNGIAFLGLQRDDTGSFGRQFEGRLV